MPEDIRLERLYARVTAIQLIVEGLLVGELANDADPKIIGEEMVKDAVAREKEIRARFGDEPYATRITEEFSGMIDRAVKRAVDRNQRRSGPSPQGKSR
jgi:hypothetical protein